MKQNTYDNFLREKYFSYSPENDFNGSLGLEIAEQINSRLKGDLSNLESWLTNTPVEYKKTKSCPSAKPKVYTSQKKVYKSHSVMHRR